MTSRRFVLASCIMATLMASCQKTATPPKPKDGPLGMKFVPMPKATFYMGWDGTISKNGMEWKFYEDFEIAVHTVTQEQWQTVMGNDPSYFSRDGEGKDKVKDIPDADLELFPVEQVSWNDSLAFIKKLNDKEAGRGYLYSLPSQAEWEYACRGGATSEAECSYQFYFDKPTNDLSSKQANFNGNSPFGQADKGPFLERTTKVGSYAPNKLGFYDMHGNVRQWCADLITSGPPPLRVYRGGSWNSVARDCRASSDPWNTPDYRGSGTGFRLARVPVESK